MLGGFRELAILCFFEFRERDWFITEVEKAAELFTMSDFIAKMNYYSNNQ